MEIKSLVLGRLKSEGCVYGELAVGYTDTAIDIFISMFIHTYIHTHAHIFLECAYLSKPYLLSQFMPQQC